MFAKNPVEKQFLITVIENYTKLSLKASIETGNLKPADNAYCSELVFKAIYFINITDNLGIFFVF